ncbi:MAG: hypothetical protein K2G66_00250 [Alistipes sp.]|nr:hypothetical protein [Alistipes sp.]
MKAIDIKAARPFQTRNDKSLGIQTYGEGNNFPQQVAKIVGASCTGKSCLNIFAQFVYGDGFNDHGLQDLVVNRRRQKLGAVLKAVAGDFTKFNGFALHVNYNANYQIVEIQHVPFEHCRFEKVDSETGEFHKIAEHDDWGRDFEGIKRFRKQDITFYDMFDPRPEVIQAQVDAAGGWDKYRGQILYYSGDGERTYPTPIYEPELTDMRIEEAISNVLGRNAANNFFPAGALVDIHNGDQSEAEAKNTIDMIHKYQGAENAGTMMYMQVGSKDEVPIFIPFTGENYDKHFTQTQATIPDNIGRMFNQPPILRAKDVGANFGADLMINAYTYYNTKTSGDRQTLSETFRMLFERWPQHVADDFAIRPLSYIAGNSLLARLGQTAVDKIMEIVKDTTIADDQKRSMLRFGYDLPDDDIDKLLSK